MNKEIKKVIYARYSTDKQNDGISIEYQLDKISDTFNLNLNDCLLLIDKASSGTNTDRIAYKELLELIDHERIDLYVYKIDRLNRNIASQQELLDKMQKNHSTLNVVNGKVDINDVNDEFMFYLMSLLAQQEAKNTSVRTKDAMMLLHKQGKHTGGRTPLGICVDQDGYYYYNDDIVLVQEIFDLYFHQMYNKQEIRRFMNNKYNLNFSKNKVSDIINNTLYQGYKQLHGVKVQVIKEPLISEQEYQELTNNLVRVNKVADKLSSKHSYLFRNKLKIDGQSPLVETQNHHSGKVYKYYRNKSKEFSIREDQIYELISNEIYGKNFIADINMQIIKLTQLGDYDQVIKLANKAKKVFKIDVKQIESIEIDSNLNSLTFNYYHNQYKINNCF